jgi:hypothetical protein
LGSRTLSSSYIVEGLDECAALCYGKSPQGKPRACFEGLIHDLHEVPEI